MKFESRNFTNSITLDGGVGVGGPGFSFQGKWALWG